jgi:hypothetical protein
MHLPATKGANIICELNEKQRIMLDIGIIFRFLNNFSPFFMVENQLITLLKTVLKSAGRARFQSLTLATVCFDYGT